MFTAELPCRVDLVSIHVLGDIKDYKYAKIHQLSIIACTVHLAAKQYTMGSLR